MHYRVAGIYKKNYNFTIYENFGHIVSNVIEMLLEGKPGNT